MADPGGVLLAGAEPYAVEGGPVGVLVMHGFTGSPHSVRTWAEHLAAAGLTVSVPRLPGHGTRWQDMARTRWEDWYAEAERAFAALEARCEQVFVCGLSMGGTIVLKLAEDHPNDVAGVITVNASVEGKPLEKALPVARLLLSTFPGIGSDIKAEGVKEVSYDKVPLKAAASFARGRMQVRQDLGKITAPVLVFRSRVDHVVPPVSGQRLMEGATSCDIEERVLENSYHVATLDNDAPLIFEGTLDFIRRHSSVSGADLSAARGAET